MGRVISDYVGIYQYTEVSVRIIDKREKLFMLKC